MSRAGKQNPSSAKPTGQDSCHRAASFLLFWNADVSSLLPFRFRYRCCSGTDGLLVAVSCCAPEPPATGRGRGIGTRDSVVSAVRTVPAS
jgi:hypothetical protein